MYVVHIRLIVKAAFPRLSHSIYSCHIELRRSISTQVRTPCFTLPSRMRVLGIAILHKTHVCCLLARCALCVRPSVRPSGGVLARPRAASRRTAARPSDRDRPPDGAPPTDGRRAKRSSPRIHTQSRGDAQEAQAKATQ